MLRGTSEKVNLNPRVKFPGICEFAQQIKVSRGHAWQVLSGLRKSNRLARAWQQFQKERAV